MNLLTLSKTRSTIPLVPSFTWRADAAETGMAAEAGDAAAATAAAEAEAAVTAACALAPA